MNENTQIREYNPEDKEAVIGLLRLNTPHFFAPEEENDLKNYLEQERDHYFIVEHNKVVVGCGGINYTDHSENMLISWDIIHPDYQRQGIGKQLLKFRLHQIKQMTGVKTIIVRTTQLAYQFYATEGFLLRKIEKDYWGKNLDLFYMDQLVQSII